MHIITVHDELLNRSQTFASINKETVFTLVNDFLDEQGIDPQDTNYPVGVVETQTDADVLLQEAFGALDRLGTFFGDHFRGYDRSEWDEFDSEVEAACLIDDTMAKIAEATGMTFKPVFSPEDRAFVDGIEFVYDEEDDDDDTE